MPFNEEIKTILRNLNLYITIKIMLHIYIRCRKSEFVLEYW